VVLVGGSTRIPRVQQIVREVFGKEPHKGVNPDEVVAVGAALQAGVLAGEVKDLLLLDVTPLSLGIETLGGVMTALIPRNTTIPTRKSETFSTAADSQTSVEVHVLQGERQLARDNRTLGRFQLVGIPAAPRGVPQIEVTFDIDANGMVNVSAKDQGTGKEQKIAITASSGLTKDEVDRMMKDAEAHADEDKKRREDIETRNQADQAVYQAEREMKEMGDKLAGSDKATLESAIAALKSAVESATPPTMKSATEALTQARHKVAEALYKQAERRGPLRAAGPRAETQRRPRVTSSTPRWWRTRRSSGLLHRARAVAGSVRDRDQAGLPAARAAPASRTSIRVTARPRPLPRDRRGVRDPDRSRTPGALRRRTAVVRVRARTAAANSRASTSRRRAPTTRRASATCSPKC
jgi:hypothetical protein